MSEKFVRGAGFRDDSDAGLAGELLGRPWTLDEVRTRALSLGKKFQPDPEIASRLTGDLRTNGVIVLFTGDDVMKAIEMGAVPKALEKDLMALVDPEGTNDIAVIPTASVAESNRERLIDWFLTNTRC